MRRFATIGVYGFTGGTFVAALKAAGVDIVLDVRQRRGVRGSEYAWANAQRLQRLLTDHGIEYEHLPQLAPTTDMRQQQYAHDEQVGVGKRNRQELAEGYRSRYLTEILDGADLDAIVARLPQDTTSAFLCVETEPKACHRSLIADRIRAVGAQVIDIVP
jgi:uncharacterized protein (DUF488 family)